METRLELLQKQATLDRGGIVSVGSVALDLARVERVDRANKFDAKDVEAVISGLIEAAQKQGMKANELDQLFEKIVKEDATATFEDFLSFDDSLLNDQTKGTTATGRSSPCTSRLVRRLIASLEGRPQRLDGACRDVALGYDKVHHAQSLFVSRISPRTISNSKQLRQRVLTPINSSMLNSREQFRRTSSVRALSQILEFRTSVISFSPTRLEEP